MDTLSKQLGSWNFGEIRDPLEELRGEIAAAGFDPEELRVRHFLRLFLQIQNLPRHLGQHSGGMVIAAGRLDEVVPLEPASMPGRVVVQWDKDDCADLGIIKVDLLGLGMLAALEEAIPMIRTHEKVEVDLAHLPPDDPKVYRMLNEADTVGLFQVESRAQMASLPRNAPKMLLRPRRAGRDHPARARSSAAWCTRSSTGGRGARRSSTRIRASSRS